jgi:type IV pilus assembly protein PilV
MIMNSRTFPLERAASQRGAFLLEAMIAILIFSLGILGIVGLQAKAMRAVGDAQYRAEATYYATALAGKMWTYDPALAKTYFSSPSGAGYAAWASQITDATTGLPGADIAGNEPTVIITDGSSITGLNALITVHWQAPSEDAPHTYVISATLGTNSKP